MIDNDPLSEPLDLPEDTSQPPHHSYPMPSKRSHSKKPLVIIIVVIVVLAGGGFAGTKLLKKKPAAAAVAPTPPTSVTPIKDLPDAGGTKTYENGQMGLSLTYPSTWTATETADSGVRIESPTFTYPLVTGNKIPGIFRLYIRKGARAVDEKYIGRGVAIAASEKLTYSAPALGQRSDTLLTNFGLDTTDNFAFLMIAGNFQLNPGETLGPTYGKEAETFIVAGGYTTKDAKDDLGTNPVPANLIKTSNAYKQAITTIKSLQLH